MYRGVLVGLFFVLSTRPGFAAEPAKPLPAASVTAAPSEVAPPPSAPAAPPDVVLLNNGGMLRGSISELVPDDYVVITLVSGETRRFWMSEVKYAGPKEGASDAAASSKPAQSATEVAEPAQHARKRGGSRVQAARAPQEAFQVRLTSATPELVFHVRTGQSVGEYSGLGVSGGQSAWVSGTVESDTFRELCVAPCTTTLPPGSYVFGLSLADKRPVRADGYTRVEAGSVIEGKYDSYAGLRAAGWITVFGSALTGAILMFSSLNDCSSDLDGGCEPVDTTLFVGGGAIMVAGAIGGFAMAYKKDEAHVEVSTTC